MKDIRPSAAVLLVICMISGCSPDKEHDHTASNPAGYEVTKHHTTGVVKAFLPDGRHIRVDHGEIQGFMDAMTMSFEVEDDALLEGIQVEDSIRFTLMVSSAGIMVTATEN